MELQVVSFLLRHQPYIPALSELGRKVSRFLGPSPNLSLSEACVYDSIALLDWIWDSSCTSIAERSSGWSLHNFLRSDNDYYKWEFAKGMQFVARGGNMKILECFFQHFEGCGVTTDIVDLAACNGHLEVLIYLQEHTTVVHENFPKTGLVLAITCAGEVMVSFWLVKKAMVTSPNGWWKIGLMLSVLKRPRPSFVLLWLVVLWILLSPFYQQTDTSLTMLQSFPIR
ncbi:hypothetical protein P3T76_014541 [Phytophthora citrophthora]|uniref:Uncharacterized protein n=1 Tax=Phytophthora citrophthora TaxID=4793 RepID=A0AAD9G0Z7_9STRA|nr:hypothetical protein P3T76_014541 [Phytophthora citrophthora]